MRCCRGTFGYHAHAFRTYSSSFYPCLLQSPTPSMASIMLGRNFYYEIPRVLLRSYTMKLSTMANYDPTVCTWEEGEGRVWYGRQTHIWRFSLTIYLYRPSTLVRSWPSWYGHGQNRYLYIRTKIPQEKRRYELINRAWNSNMLCCLFRNWCSNQITLTINLASFAHIIMRCLIFTAGARTHSRYEKTGLL